MSPLKIIDNQTLKLVDYLIELHEKTQTNLDLVTDYAFGVKYYPYNKYIVTHMRGKEVEGGKGKHAPHPLIINLGKEFNVDFNFFYDETIDVKDAFLSEGKTTIGSKEDATTEIFNEIEKRMDLFVKENKRLTGKECYKFCNATEIGLSNIQSHIYKAFSTKTLNEKREEIIKAFDQIISLAIGTIDSLIANSNLKEDIDKLTIEKQQYKEDKIRLEKSILELNNDLSDCNKSLLEAKNGETDALKQLLAIRSKN